MKIFKDDFLTKFEDRIQKVGKDGIMGIMKHTGPSINNNIFQNILFNKEYNQNLTYKPNRNNYEHNNNYYQNQEIANNNNSNILKKINEYSNQKPSYILSLTHKIKNINNQSRNKLRESQFSLDKKLVEVNKDGRSISLNNREPLIYSCQIKNDNILNYNKYEIGDNRQKIIDNGYKPYTIKDYKKLNNEIIMGNLGPDFRTKQWNEKRERMKKMSEYGKQLMNKGKENHIKGIESYEENNNNIDEIKNENGKWNIINEFSRGLSDNKNYNKKEKKPNSDYKINNIETNNQGIEKMIKQHVNINYRRKLNNLKKILF